MTSRLLLASLLLAAAIASGCAGRPQGQGAGDTSGRDASPAAAQAPAPQQETQAAPAAPSGTAGTRYVVVPENSEASYAVRERLLRWEMNGTAVGKTSAIAGEIVLEGGVIRPSVVQVDLSTLRSDEDRRDRRVREALDTNNHRFATYRITGAEGDPVLKEGQEVALRLQGYMTIKGTERPLAFDARAKLEGDTLTLTAESTFKMTDFGVTPPNIAGFVSVSEEVTVNVTFVGRRSGG